MNRMHFLIPVLLMLILTSCNSKKEPDTQPEEEDPIEVPLQGIIVNTAERQQKMDGVGANCWTFVANNDVGWNWEESKYVFDELNLHYIRMAGWFGYWEQSNDNEDPWSINFEGFDEAGFIARQDLALAQYLTSKNIEVELGIWSVGDWMLESSDPNIIDPSKYDELGEMIAAYLLWMKDNGVDIPITDIQNEPNITAANKYETADNFRDAGFMVAAQLDSNDLDHVKIHAPNLATPADVREWGQLFVNDPRLKEDLAAISYHTWWVDDFEPFNDIRLFAEENNLPVWATEIGYCALADGCFGGTHFLRPETWGTAWDYAMSYYRAIEWSRASRLYHWSVLGHDAVVNKSGEKLVSFYILKHFTQFIPPEAYYLESSAEDSDILPMLFELPDGSWSAIILNEGGSDKLIEITGDGHFTVMEARQTHRLGYYEEISEIENVSRETGYLLPAESITSFMLQ